MPSMWRRTENLLLVARFSGCCAYMVARYSIMGAHTTEPDELGKVTPTTLLQFARATKRFSCPLSCPLVILGYTLGRIYAVSALGGLGCSP